MDIKYSKQAYKYLRKLHKPKANQIISAINKLSGEDESGQLDIKRMKGIGNLYRFKANYYRILYTPTYSIIMIEKIGSRDDYRTLEEWGKEEDKYRKKKG